MSADSADSVDSAERAGGFPAGFLWGASTAAYQIEGGNVASDFWELEHAPGSVFAERSGDACDGYHRWREDLDLLAGLGLNAYRFSLEWGRIEPEQGEFSRAAIDHYRRVVAGCHERGLTPMVTLQHITVPRWFRRAGWWTAPGAADRFARYAEAVLPVLAEGVEWACTINEPNYAAMMEPVLAGAPAFGIPGEETTRALVAAHGRAREVLGSVAGLRTGWTVSVTDYQPVTDADADADADGGAGAGDTEAAEAAEAAEEVMAAWAWPRQDVFLAAARSDDFVGVQPYTRELIGPDGPLPVPDGAETTQLGWEFYPEAVGGALRHAWRVVEAGTPIVVTENGVPTADDQRRVAYLDRAVRSLGSALDDGVDVRGYMHWSLFDNFEWTLGYTPTFGLVEVDRTTFRRTPRPSAGRLGEIARANGLPDDAGRYADR
jgi:beta-glucosidase